MAFMGVALAFLRFIVVSFVRISFFTSLMLMLLMAGLMSVVIMIVPCMAAVAVRGRTHQGDNHNANQQPAHLGSRFSGAQPLLQLWNQVRQRHINKAARCHGQEKWQQAMQLTNQKITGHTTQRGHSPCQRNLDQSRPAAGAGLTQHYQITHVVRHLVGQHRHRSNQAQAHIGHESRGNQHTIAKAMHAVARQHCPAAAARLMAMPVTVTVFMTVLM